ncbi:MAG TPA: pepsin/retropepsin-like aspartic protease family protein [Chitinophagaceae bacterium]
MLLFRHGYKCIAISIAFAITMMTTQLYAGTPGPVDSLFTLFSDASPSVDSSSFTIPFSRAGNLILVKARVDTVEGNFILDTGCPHLVLNLTYFRHYPTTYAQDEEQSGMTGTISSVAKTTIKQFSFGTLRHYSVETDLVNLGHIENSKGVKILGLLGMQLLRQCEMIIDFEKNLIYIHVIGRKEASSYKHASLQDTTAYHTIPVNLSDDRIVVQTELAGKKIKLIIDSGAESNILDSRLPDNIFENVTVTGRILLAGAGNKKVEALQGDLKTFSIGGQNISSLPVVIANLEKTCFSYNGCVDGVLGFDYLSLQKIGFNFVNRKMYIWK